MKLVPQKGRPPHHRCENCHFFSVGEEFDHCEAVGEVRQKSESGCKLFTESSESIRKRGFNATITERGAAHEER